MRSDTMANIHFVNLLFHHDYIVKVNDNNTGVCLKKSWEVKNGLVLCNYGFL